MVGEMDNTSFLFWGDKSMHSTEAGASVAETQSKSTSRAYRAAAEMIRKSSRTLRMGLIQADHNAIGRMVDGFECMMRGDSGICLWGATDGRRRK